MRLFQCTYDRTNSPHGFGVGEVGAFGWGNSQFVPCFANSLSWESYGGTGDLRFVVNAINGVTARFVAGTGDFEM